MVLNVLIKNETRIYAAPAVKGLNVKSLIPTFNVGLRTERVNWCKQKSKIISCFFHITGDGVSKVAFD